MSRRRAREVSRRDKARALAEVQIGWSHGPLTVSGSKIAKSASAPGAIAPLRPIRPARRAASADIHSAIRSSLMPRCCIAVHITGNARPRLEIPPQAWSKRPSWRTVSRASFRRAGRMIRVDDHVDRPSSSAFQSFSRFRRCEWAARICVLSRRLEYLPRQTRGVWARVPTVMGIPRSRAAANSGNAPCARQMHDVDRSPEFFCESG